MAGTDKAPEIQVSPGTGENPSAVSPVLAGGVPVQNGPSIVKADARSLLPDQLVKLLQESGIPKDTATVFTIQALMGEGLSLNAESIKAVRSLVLRHAHPRRAAVLAARALAAGLQADDEGMEVLIRLLSGPRSEDAGKEPERVFGRQYGRDNSKDDGGDAGGDSGRDSRGNTGGEPESGSGKNPEEEPQREPQREPGRDADDGATQGQAVQTPGQPDRPSHTGAQAGAGQVMVQHECQNEAALIKALESAFVDLTSRAATDPGFASLGRKGSGGRGWLCVPFQFTIDGVDFSGYFRIIFNYGASKVERLVAEIDSSGLTRICDVSWSPTGKPRLRFMPGSLSEGNEFSRLFGESMQVELFHTAEAPGLIGTLYREVDGHA